MNETVTIERLEREGAHRPVERGLSVVSIAKSYDRKVVLRDVSLSVERGEVVALLGPNGAGKTTCFYSIMGLVKPDSGRILLDGEDITGLPMYRRAIMGLGYLPQTRLWEIFPGVFRSSRLPSPTTRKRFSPTSRSASIAARWSACWGRTAPARRPASIR